MTDGKRTFHLLTADESLLASTRAAVSGLEDSEFRHCADVPSFLDAPPAPGDLVLIDKSLRSDNVYELCRRLTGRTRCRTYLIIEQQNPWARAIAEFCGATGVLERPLSAAALRESTGQSDSPPPALPSDAREVSAPAALPEALLRDLVGPSNDRLIEALTDPETNLFNFEFLNFKLDEEFKRAQRFGHPLSAVMLGFEGQVAEPVLRELASIFLQTSRDTDVLGRFDESSFLFLLPHTGPDGAHVMARRVGKLAEERELKDLVGDPLAIAVGIAFHPHSAIERREDLFAAVRRSFQEALQAGGGVVTTN